MSLHKQTRSPIPALHNPMRVDVGTMCDVAEDGEDTGHKGESGVTYI